MDRADNAAQSAKESVQEVHIFLFNLLFYIFLENSFSPQWHNGLCIRFKNDNKPKTKGKKEWGTLMNKIRNTLSVNN